MLPRMLGHLRLEILPADPAYITPCIGLPIALTRDLVLTKNKNLKHVPGFHAFSEAVCCLNCCRDPINSVRTPSIVIKDCLTNWVELSLQPFFLNRAGTLAFRLATKLRQACSEWSGVEWSGAECSGAEWSGGEWSGVERSGVE